MHQLVTSESSLTSPFTSQRLVHKSFLEGSITESDIVENYISWSFDDMALLMRDEREKENGGYYHSMKLAKRGNDVYEKRLKDKVNPMLRTVYDFGIDVFEDNDNIIWNSQTSKAWSNVLFITLTFASTAIRYVDAWVNMSKYFNDFKREFSRRYGTRLDVARAWESHESFYPHIHCIIYCHDVFFKVFKMKTWNESAQTNVETFRIQERRFYAVQNQMRIEDMNEPHMRGPNLLGPLWPYGNFDVQAVQNTHEKLAYLFKYVMKAGQDLRQVQDQENFGKLVKTQAMIWVSNKRSFAANAQFWYVMLTGRRLPKGREETIGELYFSYKEERDESTGKSVYRCRVMSVKERDRLELKAHNSASTPVGVVRHDACFNAAKEPRKWRMMDIQIEELDSMSLSIIKNGVYGKLVQNDLDKIPRKRLYADRWTCTLCGLQGDKPAVRNHECKIACQQEHQKLLQDSERRANTRRLFGFQPWE